MTSIRHIEYALPERVVSNEELARENPSWNMDSVLERAGVASRRVAAPDETAFDLSVRACESLAEEPGVDFGRVDAIVYCTQSPDYVMPGNAHLLHGRLGLGDHVLAFDYNLACSGYVYGLALADALARTGMASEILLITAETYSKHINARDRSARVLFGDGAAATLLTADGGGGRIVASALGSHGVDFAKFYVPAGGFRKPRDDETQRETADVHGNVRCAEDIHMDGLGVWAWVNSTVPAHVRDFLEGRGLSVADVDLFVFHQASKMSIDSVAKALELPPEKTYVHLEHVGNLVSASIPVALRAALDEGRVRAGSRVVLCGFGVGFSYGSVLVEF